MELEFDPTPQPKQPTGWYVVISLLLLLLLAVNSASFVLTYQKNQIEAQRAATYQARVDAASQIVESQRTYILDIIDNYQKDVYGNPDVERIAEQQLIAEEYQLSVLQTIAIQNSQVLELMVAAP